jgi:transposase
VVTVTDEQDRIVVEKRVANEMGAILRLLRPWREELAGVVVESTCNGDWFADGLQAAGLTVHLANTVAIKPDAGLKHSTDETDAPPLAHLLRLGILPTGTILPPEQRAVRDLARKRLFLVKERTAHILSVENLFARQLGIRIASNEIKKLKASEIEAWRFPEAVALSLKTQVNLINVLSEQIKRIETRLLQEVGARPEFDRLCSVPGIGRILAMTILLEIDSIERFATAGHFASYARCVASQRLSNGKKKGEGNTKNGNKYLA